MKLAELKDKVKTAKELRHKFAKLVRETMPPTERGRLLTTLKTIENEKSFDKAYERLQKELQRVQFRGELARMKKFIKSFRKKYGYQKKAGLKEGGKYKMAPEFSSIFESIFNRINTKKPRTKLELEAIDELVTFARTERREAEIEARENGTEADSPYVRHEIDKRLEELAAELTKIEIQDWTPEQIRALTDGMITLVKTYEFDRSEYLEKLEIDRNIDISYGIAEIQSGWRKKKGDRPRDAKNATSPFYERGLWAGLKGLLGRYNFNLQTLVRVISGGKKGVLYRRLVRDIQSGVDDVKYEMFFLQDIFQSFLKEEGIDYIDLQEWSRLARVRSVKLPNAFEKFFAETLGEKAKPKYTRRDVKTITLKLDNGTTLSNLSVMEAIDILMHTRNEFNYNAIKNQGVVFRDQPNIVHKLTDRDLERIRQAVPERARILIRMMDTIIRVNQDSINRVSRKIDGYDLANVDGYWHIRRQVERGVKGKSETAHVYESIEARSNWRERTGGTQPVIVGDAFNNLIETLEVGSEYVGLAEVMRNARYLTRNKALKMRVVERGYGYYWNDIIKQIDRVQQKQNTQEWYEKLYSFMARNVTRAVFGVNLRVSAQQYASVFLATSELGMDSLKFIRFKYDKELVDRIAEWSPMLRERFLGAVGRELGDVAKVGSVMRFLTNQDQMINKPTFLVRFFDKLAITDVWRMSEGVVAQEYSDKYGGVTHAELLADAKKPIDERKYPRFQYDVMRRAEETIRVTQPTWDVVDRSVVASDRNPLIRAFTMFHSQREKLAQMLGLANNTMFNDLNKIRIRLGLSSLQEAAKTKEGLKAIGKMARVYGTVLTNTAMVKAWAIAYGIAAFGRDDDMYDWAWAVIADVPGMYYFGDIARDGIVAWGKKSRGKRIYQLGAYEQAPIRVISSGRKAAYEMGVLVMMSLGAVDSNDKEMSKQITKVLEETWESANYGIGLPFMHGTNILTSRVRNSRPKLTKKRKKSPKT
jgi:hypothetical protein